MILFEQLKSFWQLLRQASGDDAYERYRAHHERFHSNGHLGASFPGSGAEQHSTYCGEALLSRQQFFKLRQDERWSGVSRCC